MHNFTDRSQFIMFQFIMRQINKNYQRLLFLGKEQVVELLLKSGADPKLQDVDGRTALHRAVEASHIGIVKHLCQFCPELLHIRDKNNKLPRDYAVGKKSVEEALSEFS